MDLLDRESKSGSDIIDMHEARASIRSERDDDFILLMRKCIGNFFIYRSEFLVNSSEQEHVDYRQTQTLQCPLTTRERKIKYDGALKLIKGLVNTYHHGAKLGR